ncbi:MAG: glycosyltransferase family 4 protein [Rikenellaceae bacterium]
MRILIIHNKYSTQGGEESVVAMQQELFSKAGDTVFTYFRDYNEMKRWKLGKVGSFFTSLANFAAYADVKKIIEREKIEVVFVHNLFPIISPLVLLAVKRAGVKSIMFLHNYRLLCPTGLFLNGGKVCEKCAKGVREFNCIKYRCEGSFLGSVAYALRSFSARIFGLYRKNIDVFAPTTDFQRQKLVQYGFNNKKLKVIPNFTSFMPLDRGYRRDGSVLYVGRLSYEKGFDLVFNVARLLPEVKFLMAGRYNEKEIATYDIPQNVELLGGLNREQLIERYQTSSLLLFPTRCYESFPLTLLEAGVNYLPVVGSNIGATQSIIKNGDNGLLFEVGNCEDMAQKLKMVLTDSDLAQKLAKSNFNRCNYGFSGGYSEIVGILEVH